MADIFDTVKQDLDVFDQISPDKTPGGGFAEFGKGLVDAYLLGGKGALGTVAAATTRTRKEPTMIPSLGYQKIGFDPESAIPKALRTGQQRIESARESFEMTHAGVSAKAGRILGNAIGYMSQAMAMGYTAGPVGAAMVGFNIEGQSAYDEAIKSGASVEQAQQERLVVGSINAGIEALQITRLMKFQQAGKHSLKNFVRLAKERAYKQMLKTGKQFGADILRHSIEEGIEELVQEGVSVSVPALFRGEYPKKEDGTIDVLAVGERLGAALVGGAFAGGVLGTAGQVRIGLDQNTIVEQVADQLEAGASEADIETAVKQQIVGNIQTRERIVSRFPENITDKESLERIGNAIADELGVERPKKWSFVKKSNERAVSGYWMPSTKTLTVKQGEQAYHVSNKAGVNWAWNNFGVRVKIGDTIWPSQGFIKRTIIHELSHVGQHIARTKTGKRIVHPPEFKALVQETVKRLFDKKQVPISEADIKSFAPPVVEQPKPSESIPEAMDIGEVLGYGHAIPEALGMQGEERRAYNEALVGKRSMADMNPQELEDLMWQLRKDADAAGIDLNKLAQQFQPGKELNKQLQSIKRYKKPLGEFEQRRKGKILKAADWTKSKIESYLLRQDRMKNICRMLDGYKEDGPMSRLVFEPVKAAAVKAKDAANMLMYNLRRSAEERGIDISKMFKRGPITVGAQRGPVNVYRGQKTGKLYRDEAALQLEQTETGTRLVDKKTGEEVLLDQKASEAALAKTKKGKQILLSDSEAVGIYYLAQNPKARKNIEAMFKEDDVDPQTAIQSINDYVEKNEDLMYVYRDTRAYFDTMGPRFFDVVKQLEIKGVVPEQNYITMLLNKGDEEGTSDILAEMTEQFGFTLPGKKHVKERTGAIRSMNMDIFSITAQASRSLERFINVAPVVKKTNTLIEKQSFKKNLNAATRGKGVGIFKKWLADSARGSSNINMTSIDKTATWLRRNSVLYTLGAKIFTVVPKQAISLSNAVAKRPAMLPVVLKTINRMADPRVSKQLEERAVSKSKLVKNRDWERDLRKVWNTATIKKFFKGKKLSPLAMRSITWMDRKTVTIAWNSAYDLALADGLEENQARKYADDVVQTTQPMASVEDLPDYFRGGPVPKALTTFMNQRNQNWQFLRHDILGEKTSKGLAMYRFLFSQILPSMMLGMITRGRLPKDAKEMALDLASYIVTPQIFLGRFVFNVLTGEWYSDVSAAISALPLRGFEEISRGADALQRGDYRKVAERGVGAVGAFTGKIPQQAITTGGGIIDLAIGETDNYKRLIYSEYIIKKYGEEEPKGMWE